MTTANQCSFDLLMHAGQNCGCYAIILLMNKLFAALSVAAFLAIVAMMFLWSPTEVGPLGIFIFFGLCFLFFLGLAVNICKLFLVIADKIKKNGVAAIDEKSKRYGVILAIAPELAIILNTGGSLTWWHVILICVCEFLIWLVATFSRV